MKLRLAPIVILIVVAAISAAVYHRLTRAPDDAPRGGVGGRMGLTPPTVDVVVIVPTDFADTVDLTGEVVAEDLVEVRPEVPGRVERILFQEGRAVSRGQLLVKLNDADLQARKSRILSQLKLEQKRVERLRKVRTVDAVSDEDFDAALAAEAIRASELAEVQAQIDKTELRAPFSGRMGLRRISVGAVVNSSSLISTITSTSSLNVDVNVPDRYAASLQVGRQLAVYIGSGAALQMRVATITAIEPMMSSQNRTQQIRARLQSSSGIVSGQFARVRLDLGVIRNALLVPTEAVVQDMRGATVYRVRSGNVERCDVQLGARTSSMVHVVNGLSQGDSVITNGILFVKPGKPVRVSRR